MSQISMPSGAPSPALRLRRTIGLAVLATALVAGAILSGSAAPVAAARAAAQPVTYSATVTVPAPPASGFAGASGGGDGWAIGLTSSQVFNVFHHAGSVTVNCHQQSDASACWTNPKTVVDAVGGGFSNSIGPGLYVDQGTGKMYTTAVRNADNVGGVVCIDTTQPVAATGAELFCGFTALTAANESQGAFLSGPVQVGNRWFTFNEWVGAPALPGQDALLCFDLSTKAACANQPFAVDRGGKDFQGYSYSFPISAIGSRVVMQLFSSAGTGLACFDTATDAKCSGTWPVTTDASNGPPLPILNGNGNTLGVCNSNGTFQCFDLSGASTPAPPGMAAAMLVNQVYGGQPTTIGQRIYVTQPSSNRVACYDFAQQASCASFPKTFSNLSLIYTTNPDPQRPSCIWVNADGGSQQIQNFDAFTGGPCGAGAIRVLTSSIVVPRDECIPASYTSLQVLDPPRSGYGTGDVDFQDGSGNPIAGIPQHHFDGTGLTSLTDLHLSTQNALPQFLISLNNPTTPIGSVRVKLTWTGTASSACAGSGITVTTVNSQGYRLAASDGGVFAFGSSLFTGSLGAVHLNSPIVGIATTPSGNGYWLVGQDGGVFAFGDAPFAGSLPGLGISGKTVKGIAATSSGLGYWIVDRVGAVYAFGDAVAVGSLPGLGISTTTITGIAAAPSGNGYWLVGQDGGVFAFGTAPYQGSLPGLGLATTGIRGIAGTPSGNGYWLVGQDGGVFAFGDALYAGSVPGLPLAVNDVVGLIPSPSGAGYWLAESSGGVLSFGDATFQGALAVSALNKPPVAIGH